VVAGLAMVCIVCQGATIPLWGGEDLDRSGVSLKPIELLEFDLEILGRKEFKILPRIFRREVEYQVPLVQA